MANYLTYLHKMPFLSDLNDQELEEIEKLITIKNYKKRQVLFGEDEPGEAIHFLISGKVKLTKNSETGRELIIGIRQAGEIFAEVVLFGGGNYPVTAEAIEDAKVGLLFNSDIEKMIKNNSNIAISIIKTLSSRLRTSQQKVKDLALKDTQGSMLSTLRRLVQEHGINDGNQIIIDLNLTHQEFANFIGTSRESANRFISELRKNEIIDIDKGKIIIKDVNKFEHL